MPASSSVFCNWPLAVNASCQGFSSTAGNCNCACSVTGQSPSGCRSPCRLSCRSSRSSRRLSMRIPLLVQCAASCKSPSRSLPSRRSCPTLTSPSSMASGKRRVGNCSGALSVGSVLGAKAMSMRSACNRSMHKVARSKQAGDQASDGACISTVLPPSAQVSRLACQLPARRPWKSATSSPGTLPSAQRLPAWVPSSKPSTRPMLATPPSRPSEVNLITRFTARAPWKSAGECPLRHPAPWPGPGAAARPAIPSAHQTRHRS